MESAPPLFHPSSHSKLDPTTTRDDDDRSSSAKMVDIEEYKLEIQRTFNLVKPISTQAAAIFYPTLWEVDPSTKDLFKNTNMDKQGEKLMKVLGIAVGMLKSMDKLVPVLQGLGRRHVSYGVTAEMYPSVKEALLITLDKGLGDECTPATKTAWTWVLEIISDVCIAAAKEVDPKYSESKKEEKEVEEPTAVPIETKIASLIVEEGTQKNEDDLVGHVEKAVEKSVETSLETSVKTCVEKKSGIISEKE